MNVGDANAMVELTEKLDGLVNFSVDVYFDMDNEYTSISRLMLNKPSFKRARPIPGTKGKVKTTDHVLVVPVSHINPTKEFLVEIYEGANGNIYSFKDLIFRGKLTMIDTIKKILE